MRGEPELGRTLTQSFLGLFLVPDEREKEYLIFFHVLEPEPVVADPLLEDIAELPFQPFLHRSVRFDSQILETGPELHLLPLQPVPGLESQVSFSGRMSLTHLLRNLRVAFRHFSASAFE